MATILVKEDMSQMTEAAVELAKQSLDEAVAAYGQALWILAGGTTPTPAYNLIAGKYADKFDWQHILVAMGDERCVAIGHSDSNWLQASTAMLDHVAIPEANKLRPPLGLVAEKAAKLYEASLLQLPQKQPGIPRLNHVWFGIGDDGHTFSLFPSHPALDQKEDLVVPVHNAPKPPPDRISLSLKALTGVENCLIMVSGSEKAAVVARALQADMSLPVTRVAATIETAGGQVTWLLDKEAASLAQRAAV